MLTKPINCPNCLRVLTHYANGYGEYYQKCHKCKDIVRIYSAGKTMTYESQTDKSDFKAFDNMARNNRGQKILKL
jgi:phage FluMu protein Com